MNIVLTHAAQSDMGCVRAENQDRWFADDEFGLYIVADGIGGNVCGGLAAQVVVDTLPELVRQRLDGVIEFSAPGVKGKLCDCLSQLSNRLRTESRGQAGLDGMGSTVVAALVHDDQLVIGHMGDSRAYLLRDGKLRQLTNDHSIVELLVRGGEITADDSRKHPARGQLSRFVGMEEIPLPEVRRMRLCPSDRLLLCTDGLTNMLSDQQLTTILTSCENPISACRRLIEAANEAGGKDNITVVLVVSDETHRAERRNC